MALTNETHGRMSEFLFRDSEQGWIVEDNRCIKIPEDDNQNVYYAEHSEDFPKYKNISNGLHRMTLWLKLATYQSIICMDLDLQKKVEGLRDQIVKLEYDTLTFLQYSQNAFTGMIEAYNEYLQYFDAGEVARARNSLSQATVVCSEIYERAKSLYTAYQTSPIDVKTISADTKTKQAMWDYKKKEKEELEEAKRSHESNENEANKKCQEYQNQINKEETKRTRAVRDKRYGLAGAGAALCVIALAFGVAATLNSIVLALIVGMLSMISMFWFKWVRDLCRRKTQADWKVEEQLKHKEAESNKAMEECKKKTEAEKDISQLTKKFPQLKDPGAVKELLEAINDLIFSINHIEYVMLENEAQWKMVSDAVMNLKIGLDTQSKHVDDWKEMPKDEVMARLSNDNSHITFMKAGFLKLCTFVAHRKHYKQCKQSLQKRLDEMNELQTDNPTHEEALEKAKTVNEELRDFELIDR